MITERLKKAFKPLENETLDEYLIRALREEEIMHHLLQEIDTELKKPNTEEQIKKLEYMKDVMTSEGKYGVHPDSNGREALWEKVYSRPANYGKPSFLVRSEKDKETNISVRMTPTLKANIQDSLHFLMELNREIKALKQKDLSEEDFIKYVLHRSVEWGYISDHKQTFKIIEQLRNI